MSWQQVKHPPVATALVSLCWVSFGPSLPLPLGHRQLANLFRLYLSVANVIYMQDTQPQ